MEEMIDEVNSQGEVIATHPKSLLKKKMFLHKVCLILPTTAEGRIVIGRRAKEQYPFPDTWCCAFGGKVVSGEPEDECAIRETREEGGYEFGVRRVTHFVYDKPDYMGFFIIYTSIGSVDVSKFVLDKRETQRLEPFHKEELEEMVQNNPEDFSPTFRDALKVFLKNYN